MGLLSHKVNRSNLEAGDHIYAWRTGFTYSHHGIYIGGDKVVHFTQDLKLSSSDPLSFISSSVSSVRPSCLDFPDCGFRKHRSGVTMSCLNCFIGNGSLYQFEYEVSQCVFIAKLRGGTCTTAKSDPPEDVIHRAMHLLHNGFGNYGLFTNNCEDFALYCKTGLLVGGQASRRGSSGQASSAISASVAVVLSLPLGIFVSSPVAVGATAVNYTLNRYANDIGVRGDVIKVNVEDIAPFHNRDQSDAQPRKRKRHS